MGKFNNLKIIKKIRIPLLTKRVENKLPMLAIRTIRILLFYSFIVVFLFDDFGYSFSKGIDSFGKPTKVSDTAILAFIQSIVYTYWPILSILLLNSLLAGLLAGLIILIPIFVLFMTAMMVMGIYNIWEGITGKNIGLIFEGIFFCVFSFFLHKYVTFGVIMEMSHLLKPFFAPLLYLF
jgi:hypothetical protein